tara:strand:+ start:312 stop:596 length:285 start_codon:yes stop_codon:yes gene_type:complete
MDEQPFPLERILNVSATEYCASNGTDLKDYTMMGIHVESQFEEGDIISEFEVCVPRDAEVVVNYRTNSSTSASFWRYFVFREAHGTALIPKRKY